ncbi:MAG: hypothetical protein FJ216_03115 [Ignavibacteria bacterium]|nr:hypothetical protein [Ignavibacteria bacterium]
MFNKLLSAFIIIFLFIFEIGHTQNFDKKSFRPVLSHPLKYSPENDINNPVKTSRYSYPDTFTVIAILVQFQQDSDPFSTGDGRFDLSNKYFDPIKQKDTVIDSPPYDSAYFADHLEFLKNYFYKSSKGKLIINYKLYSNIITLSKQMKFYSPQKNENNAKLCDLFVESWTNADSTINFSGLDSARTAFIIFHAGIGRDVDLTSIYGYDPTPYDIPSVYLGIKNLQEIFGSSYSGYQTSEGFYIKNSLIIPSAEIRELDLTSGKFLLELGMNGILAGSFGSFLGLPDLFNTQTGKTAIGRFGLMDGQSIFSFNGIFPPEPSAWEKIYLGWVQPIVIGSGEDNYRIKTSSFDQYSDSTIFKVLINSREYFLIENRNRDPHYSGQVVYTRNRNFKDSSLYTQDIPGFIYYDISKVDGNLINVKTLDWSLPGAIDNNVNYRGGILIWHIDENVIEANINTNSINNNIEHKGIDLEEAKGAQEIGYTVNTIFGPVTGDGTPVDYWFNGDHQVPNTIYKNEFTPTSLPNSLSYSLANNNIYINNFDTISPIMNFRIRIGSNELKPLAGFPKFIGIPTNILSQPVAFDINGDNKDEFFANNMTGMFGFKYDGTSITGNTSGMMFNNSGLLPASIIYSPIFSGTRRFVTYSLSPGIPLNNLNINYYQINNNYQIIDSISEQIQCNLINSIPIYFDSSKIIIPVNYGTYSRIYERHLDGTPNLYIDSSTIIVNQLSKLNNSMYGYSYGNEYILFGNMISDSSTDTLRMNFQYEKIYLNGLLFFTNQTLESFSSSPLLADINRDGKQEIIIFANRKIYAYNFIAVLLENFPINLNKNVTSGSIIGDINNDGIFDIIFTTEEGDLYAYGVNGKVIPGFPIKTGNLNSSSPSFANLNDTLGIILYGSDGYLYAYKTSYRYIPDNILWKNYQKDSYYSNSNFKSTYTQPLFSEKLPSDKVYNWPNPVYDNKTYIRYYINGTVTSVSIKILDLAGELVTKLNGTTHSNSDNEIIWDVSNVQSGVYFALIEADIDGSKESKIIKIAVVK